VYGVELFQDYDLRVADSEVVGPLVFDNEDGAGLGARCGECSGFELQRFQDVGGNVVLISHASNVLDGETQEAVASVAI